MRDGAHLFIQAGVPALPGRQPVGEIVHHLRSWAQPADVPIRDMFSTATAAAAASKGSLYQLPACQQHPLTPADVAKLRRQLGAS